MSPHPTRPLQNVVADSATQHVPILPQTIPINLGPEISSQKGAQSVLGQVQGGRAKSPAHAES